MRPVLVCEVGFDEWTEDGVLRHPSFLGLREDEAEEEVVREMPGEDRQAAARPAARTAGGARAGRNQRAGKAAAAGESGDGTARRRARGASEVGGVRITHPERIVYPEAGLSKRGLAEYYAAVADLILPHLAGRPLSLVRCPQGLAGDCFFQKHIEASFPASVRRVEVTEKDGEAKAYAVVESREGLLALVQMGVLEIHTWGSRRDRLERPDVLVFDLDPDEGLPWSRVVEAARAVRGLLAELGLDSFVKTTGGKGLHVVVPIERRSEWEEVREFTRGVAETLVAADPERFVANMSKARRKGRVFVDYLRNARGATFIAPWSSRARPGATVAVPVAWDALARVRPGRFTVADVPRLLARRKADPWAGWGSVRQSVSRATRRAVGAG